jgi:hypothetical protein
LERKKRQRELDNEDSSCVAHLSKQLKVAKAERKQILLERQKVLAKTQAAEEGDAAIALSRLHKPVQVAQAHTVQVS